MVRWQWFASDTAVCQAALDFISRSAKTAISARGAFHIVLAGGTTPRAVYQQLRDLDTDWHAWHVYFGDERALPAEHADRNSKMAADAWLSHVPIPALQIHPMPTELGLDKAYAAYTTLLADVGDFDLVLLGLGEDGHTASLFPGHEWGSAADAPDVFIVRDAPKPPPQRLSLSAQRLSRSRAVLFMVAGEGKRDAIKQWRAGSSLPAATIQCPEGVDVFLDRAAWSE